MSDELFLDLLGQLLVLTVEFELPSDVARYVKIILTGASITAGTWSCGLVVRGGVQTAA